MQWAILSLRVVTQDWMICILSKCVIWKIVYWMGFPVNGYHLCLTCLWELCYDCVCLLLCVIFKIRAQILYVVSKTVCYSRSNFMLTIKGETGWSCISSVSLVNIAQLLFTFMPGQIETHQSCKAGVKIWSLMHSINFHIFFSTTKEECAVTFQIKICPFQLTFIVIEESKCNIMWGNKMISGRAWFCSKQMFIYFYYDCRSIKNF